MQVFAPLFHIYNVSTEDHRLLNDGGFKEELKLKPWSPVSLSLVVFIML